MRARNGLILALGLLGACDYRADLTGLEEPIPANAPVLSLSGDSVVIREGASIVGQLKQAGRVRIAALLLDEQKTVVWQSAVVETSGGQVEIPVTSLPASLVGRRLMMTVGIDFDGGRRVYASKDDKPAGTVAEAATLPAPVRAGRFVALGSAVTALAADAPEQRVFATRAGSGDVLAIDLDRGALGAPVVREDAEIVSMARVGRTLAYLTDAGSRVVFHSLSGAAGHSSILGPQTVLIERTFPPAEEGKDPKVDSIVETVRPYGTSIHLACEDAASVCARPVALVPSATDAGAVLRVVRPGEVTGPLLTPGWTFMGGGPDTIPATFSVFGPRRSDGAYVSLDRRAGVMGCVATRMGGWGASVTAAGRLFSVSTGQCGSGSRVVRVDGAAGSQARLAKLASHTVAAEDRLQAIKEIRASHDGARVLLRDQSRIWLADQDLRVIGSIDAKMTTAVAWMDGAPGEPLRFVIARGGALEIYEADRFTHLATVATGPLADAPVVFAQLASGKRMAAVVPADRPDAVVVLSLPTL